MKTLLVEDDPDLRALLERLLARRNYQVQPFDTAESAWQSCASETYDMAILDWMLPGITGLELCRRMRATPAFERTLVIMLTGRVEPNDLDEVLAAGADDYWTKPIDAERLRIRLRVAERQAQTIAERGRAEDALRASVERFELAARGTNDGIFDGPVEHDDLFSPATPFWFSARYKALLGYAENEAPDVRGFWMDLIHPDDRDRVFAALRGHLLHRTPYDIEYRLRMKTGEYRWFSGRAHALWNSEGRPIRLAGAIRDITQRKLMEEALHRDQRMLKQLLEVHERERQLFAYEIHDGVIQQITGSLMHLEAFAEVGKPAAGAAGHEFEQGVQLLREAVADARRLLSGLRPPILDELGVIAAIEYLVAEARRFIATVDFVHDVSFQRLAPPLESALFRIAQEALNNTRRHSGAKSARILLTGRDGRLQLEIIDDGIGFRPEELGDENFGLQGIRERARLLGGTTTITSLDGHGTSVAVEFPLPDEAEEWS